MKKNVTLGVLLCIAALILMQKNQWGIGLIAFVLGMFIMNRR